VYGDPAIKNVLEFARVDLARAVIIAIPDRHTQELVIANAQTLNRHIKFYAARITKRIKNISKSLGVDAVIQPEFEAAISIVERLLPSFGVSEETWRVKFQDLRFEHGEG